MANCVPGDLARVVSNSFSRSAGMDNKIIKVIETTFSLTDKLSWRYEGKEYKCICGCGMPIECVPDEDLRPIRDNPGEDETLQWTPVPQIELTHA